MQAPKTHRERHRVVLDLLEAIECDGMRSQRDLAETFGVALGLINAHLTNCIKRGFVKVRSLSCRRYEYLLTDDGAAEKLRLTLLLVSDVAKVLRRVRTDYQAACSRAVGDGWHRIVLVGASELAEVSVICALENDLDIVAIVDSAWPAKRFAGARVVRQFSEVTVPFDGALITDGRDPEMACAQSIASLGSNAVIIPDFLALRRRANRQHELG